MNNPQRKSIALLIYSDPFHFPPTINAANILAEKGFDVHLIGYENTDDWSQQLNNKVKQVSLGRVQTGIRSVIKYFRSLLFLRSFLKKNEIGWIIGYDAKSVLPAYFATRSRKIKWLYHQHDFWEFPVGIWERFLWRCERKYVKHANLVSFPQLQRAEFFQKAAGLKSLPLIVFNGPRKVWIEQAVNENEVIANLRTKFKYLLIYQGGWSKYFRLERLFDAMAIAVPDIALVVLGEEREKGLRNEYIQYLQNAGISERVYLADKYIPYEALTGFTKYCDAAIGKLTGDNDDAPFNDRYLIGAANKITEYIACGLPVILQDSLPNKLFTDKYPIGILVDTSDKYKFLEAITGLLANEANMQALNRNNRQLFLNELNFDDQFQKILEFIN